MRVGGLMIAGLVVACAAAGCDGDEAVISLRERGCAGVMFDSSGARYLVDERDGRCFPTVDDEDAAALGGTTVTCIAGEPGLVVGWARFFEVCPVCGSEDRVCRPLVCATDDECPYFWSNDRYGSAFVEYECRRGLCQHADRERHPTAYLNRRDADLLCEAPLDRDDSYAGPDPCPGIVDSSDPAACPLPLPDDCLQP